LGSLMRTSNMPAVCRMSRNCDLEVSAGSQGPARDDAAIRSMICLRR
jgi:hypothetical protein